MDSSIESELKHRLEEGARNRGKAVDVNLGMLQSIVISTVLHGSES